MNIQGNRTTLRYTTTFPDTITELKEMEAKLVQDLLDIDQSKQPLELRLGKVRQAISNLTEILGSPSGDTPDDNPTNAPNQGAPYDSWVYYRNLGHEIPDFCPVTPSELRKIMADHPVLKGTKVSRIWEITKARNMSAMRLMASECPNGEFSVHDFAMIMGAVGMFTGTAKRYKTTLIRHLGLDPDFENLGNGRWKYLKFNDAESPETVASEVALQNPEHHPNGAEADLALVPTDSVNEDAQEA